MEGKLHAPTLIAYDRRDTTSRGLAKLVAGCGTKKNAVAGAKRAKALGGSQYLQRHRSEVIRLVTRKTRAIKYMNPTAHSCRTGCIADDKTTPIYTPKKAHEAFRLFPTGADFEDKRERASATLRLGLVALQVMGGGEGSQGDKRARMRFGGGEKLLP